MKKQVERRAKRLLCQAILRTVGTTDGGIVFKGPLKSLVILAQEKLGDAILLTPLIGMLRKTHPDLQIDVVTYGPNYGFFERDPAVSMVLRGKRDYINYFKTLKARRYDLLFSTKDHPSFTFLYQARVIPARYSVGILHPMHDGFFNHMIPIDFHRHVIEKNCALLGFLGVSRGNADLRPYLPAADIRSDIRVFSKSLAGRNAVGINLSAGSSDREWPVELWERVIGKLRGPVVVFAMPDRTEAKTRLEARFKNILPSPQTESIFEAGEILARLGLLVSPDTALVHAASCFKIPVVGLYRSDVIHLERFYPFGVPHRLAVSRTQKVEDIPAEEVIRAIREFGHG